ncbi:MAG: efflux RND transporter periplasmic adaptor subunit [Opitutaceae bacterium]
MKSRRPAFWISVSLVTVLVLLVALRFRSDQPSSSNDRGGRRVPVAVAPIVKGPIELRRTFTGALEAYASFIVAPKVGGRIRSVYVDISDPVDLGQIVARLDDAEIESEEAQAAADLAVTEAGLVEARSQAEIALRDLKRLDELRDKGFTSDSEYEVAEAAQMAREARLKVAEAQVVRARAALNATRIRRGYSSVVADWDGEDAQRIVAERFVDEGETVSANTPLLRIVEIDRIIAVITVTERDYASLRPGQEGTIVTDAYPGVTFLGTIERIAPVFRETTRQARVEMLIENKERKLKPGMFMRATLVLDRVESATIVPESALTRREGVDGCFLLDDARETVRWVEVSTGLRDGERVQVFGDGLNGEVVVLGQQLLDDGSMVSIPESSGADPTQ